MALQLADIGNVRRESQFEWGARARKIGVGFGHVNFEVLAGYSNQSAQLLKTFPSCSAETSRNQCSSSTCLIAGECQKTLHHSL